MTVQLYTRQKGQGPALVMLHGLFGSGDNLGGIARLLSEEFQVTMMDLRNHGRSPHADSMTYGEMAEDVFAAMDTAGIQSANVFGHSMGGKVAMQMALMQPARIEKLIVGDIAPVAYGNHHSQTLAGLMAVANEAPQSREEASASLAAYVSEPDVLGFLLTNWRKNAEGVWAWRINLDVIASNYSDIAASVEGMSYDGPTLFLRGSQSDYIRSEYKNEILSLFPRATVKTVEGTGHWLHAEKPSLVARAISKFLGE